MDECEPLVHGRHPPTPDYGDSGRGGSGHGTGGGGGGKGKGGHAGGGHGQGRTLVHFSAQRKRFLWNRGCI